MPSSVLGDPFDQAQDSRIISWTRVLALDSALGSGKHATINLGEGQPRHPLEGYNVETDHILVKMLIKQVIIKVVIKKFNTQNYI